MTKIAIFASGSGTNAENIIKSLPETISISYIYCNNPNAGVIERAHRLGVEIKMLDRENFYHSDKIIRSLTESDTSYIILAGFLWLIPSNIIEAYRNKIINIHPALLPKYGGKGMYGMHVHKAVAENKESETGITIHLINEKYDDGKHLFQARCSVSPSDTPETIAQKVHELEYKHFPSVIFQYISTEAHSQE